METCGGCGQLQAENARLLELLAHQQADKSKYILQVEELKRSLRGAHETILSKKGINGCVCVTCAEDPKGEVSGRGNLKAICACEVLGVEPCGPDCTCRTPVLSGGCSRCATYGSEEQRLAAAKAIAEAVGKREAGPLQCGDCGARRDT